jgi:hypothetical protein
MFILSLSPLTSTFKCNASCRCRFSHDLNLYLESKPEDLEGDCVNMANFGKCEYGVKCRYLKSHAKFENMPEKPSKVSKGRKSGSWRADTARV